MCCVKIDDKMYEEMFSEETGKSSRKKDKADGDITVIQLNNSVVTATVFDWLSSLFTALVCVLLVLCFAFRVIDVDGTSMEPTLIDTDKVVITDLFYTPHNGDVIVISHGEDYEKPLVKRVIAIAGQELRIDFDNNEVYVDGEKLDESYIQGVTIRGDKSPEEINGVIPEGKIFVMGDNRTVSLDSRYHSVDLIDVGAVIGKAQLVVIPHAYGSDGVPYLDFGRLRYIYQ
jgi:signal peptidase I